MVEGRLQSRRCPFPGCGVVWGLWKFTREFSKKTTEIEIKVRRTPHQPIDQLLHPLDDHVIGNVSKEWKIAREHFGKLQNVEILGFVALFEVQNVFEDPNDVV